MIKSLAPLIYICYDKNQSIFYNLKFYIDYSLIFFMLTFFNVVIFTFNIGIIEKV